MRYLYSIGTYNHAFGCYYGCCFCLLLLSWLWLSVVVVVVVWLFILLRALDSMLDCRVLLVFVQCGHHRGQILHQGILPLQSGYSYYIEGYLYHKRNVIRSEFRMNQDQYTSIYEYEIEIPVKTNRANSKAPCHFVCCLTNPPIAAALPAHRVSRVKLRV